MKEFYSELENFSLDVSQVGKPEFDSPLNLSNTYGDDVVNYTSDNEKILAFNSTRFMEYWNEQGKPIPTFEKAGPRSKLFFEPGKTVCAIVTCGGLCPGLNAVIRALVMMNWHRYGNRTIYGIQYGYEGFIDEYNHPVIKLTPEMVKNIHKSGGTFLGSSRGPQDVGRIVDKLVELKVNILYTIGGDGTLRGADAIHSEIAGRGLDIGVIGIPKTIDNDIAYINKSFGTETAFSSACEAIQSAHTEATGAFNGVGLVKVMGRHSGFIAANATLASSDVNFCLIPEVPFTLDGENGFLHVLEERLARSHHAVVLIAEGAGQDIIPDDEVRYDKSGNKILEDIGLYLKNRIKEHFSSKNIPFTVKYIDPSYIIRSTPPTPNDAVFCLQLAQHAVHAGMAGKTGIVIGFIDAEFIHLPIDIAVSRRKLINPESELWLSVLENTGQPIKMG
jgi:6-phosphofructokinase 1